MYTMSIGGGVRERRICRSEDYPAAFDPVCLDDAIVKISNLDPEDLKRIHRTIIRLLKIRQYPAFP